MEDKLREILDETGDAMKGRFLTFLVGEETYGIEIQNIVEIVKLQPITEMPEMPDYMKGIINLRGSIIPAMDARLRFKKPKKDYTNRVCVIIINLNGASIGLIVDCVSEVLAIPEKDIAKNPNISTRSGQSYVKSIGKLDKQIVLLIDCERLLNVDELEAVSKRF